MFKKAKKTEILNINLYDIGEKLLYSGPINELNIPENIVIEKSIEFFDDSEPCFIHKSAVISRLCGEIEQYIKEHPTSSNILLNIEDMPFKTYLCGYTEAIYIKYNL